MKANKLYMDAVVYGGSCLAVGTIIMFFLNVLPVQHEQACCGDTVVSRVAKQPSGDTGMIITGVLQYTYFW